MKYIFFTVGLLLSSARAHADILFLDMNFSPAEVAAAKRAAQVRGERVWIFPERSDVQQKELAQKWQASEELASEFGNCRKRGAGGCADLERRMKAADLVARQLALQILQPGTLNFETILSGLEARNVRLSSLVLSGHSGGQGTFGGLFGSVTVVDVLKGFGLHPSLLSTVRSILLMGCYSGTLDSLHNVWQKNFPSVHLFAGYQRRAPLGIRSESGELLADLLLRETSLLNATGAGKAHRVFRSLRQVADLDATAEVNGTFLSYEEAETVQSLLLKCQSVPENLMTSFTCYDQAMPGCENPPPDHMGPLRELYSLLQVNRHCFEILKAKYADIPSPDYLIRLIFYDNVKLNFGGHYGPELEKFRKLVADAGLPSEINVENYVHSTRAADLRRLEATQNLWARLAITGGRGVSDSKLKAFLKIQSSTLGLSDLLNLPAARLKPHSCIPFSWVEPSSSETDTCGLFRLALQDEPLDLSGYLRTSLALDEFVSTTDLALEISPKSSADPLAPLYKSILQKRLTFLRAIVDRTPDEERILNRLAGVLEEVDRLSDREIADRALRELDRTLQFLDDRIARLDPTADADAVKACQAFRAIFAARKEIVAGIPR